jgi:hypothetical protein
VQVRATRGYLMDCMVLWVKVGCSRSLNTQSIVLPGAAVPLAWSRSILLPRLASSGGLLLFTLQFGRLNTLATHRQRMTTMV